MNIIQAIESRKSRRSYLATPIERPQLSILKSRVDEYNQKSGLSIRLVENGSSAFSGLGKSYGMFSGVRSFFVMKGPADDPDLKEKVGYFGELLVLEATAMNLGTCWVGATFDSSGIRVGSTEALVCVIAVGNVSHEETFKERMIYKAIHRKSKSIGEMSEVIGEPPIWLKQGMKAVQKAPSTRNTQKVLFLYKAGVLRASIPDTYRFDYVDLGIAKAHFSLAAGGHFELGNGGKYYPTEMEQHE